MLRRLGATIAPIALISTLLVGAGTAPEEGVDPPAPGSGWDVPHLTVNDAGATVLNDGHVDIAALLEDGSLLTRVKDTSRTAEPVWREIDDVVFQLLPSSAATVPQGAAWAFLGEPGSGFYQVTQRQQEGLLWPGWSTEAIPVSATAGGVDWALTDMSGPGEFALYETGGFGEPSILFSTRDGITDSDRLTIAKNTHAHGSWAFTAAGAYCLAFERSTTTSSGQTLSDEFTLAVAVGDADVRSISARDCFDDDDRPADDHEPVGDADLTPETAEGVRVAERDGVVAGGVVSVALDAAYGESWVSVWMHSAQAWLGWVRLDAAGEGRIRLAAGLPPGEDRIVVKHRDGSVIGWTSVLIVPAGGGEDPVDPAPTPGPSNPPAPQPGAVWDVPNATVNAKGATVLNNGHVDVASLVEGGRLVTRIKDTTRSSTDPVWRETARTVLQLLPSARARVPADPAYAFLGAPGDAFYQVTQTQQRDLLWPGWSTEAIALDATTGGVSWALVDIAGPGRFSLYETDSFGTPTVLFSTADGITQADRLTIPKNTHAHGSWAFSHEGNYCLSMQRAAQLSDGRTVTDAFVLAIAVGTADVMQVDPARCGEEVDDTPGGALPPPPPAEDAAEQEEPARDVAATSCVSGARILSAGHIDYASRIVDGRLESMVGDDTSGTKVYREPATTVLWLKPSSRVVLPPGFGQVGAAGSTVWQVPQTQNPALVWLGWNTESLNAGNTRGPVAWSIDSIDGPGSVTVYTTGSFGGVQEIVFDGRGGYSIPLGVHAHANWAFSAEGIYRLTMTQTADLVGGGTSSDTETLTIAVGDVDPATALAGGAGCGAGAGAAGGEGDLHSAQQVAAHPVSFAVRPASPERTDAPEDELAAVALSDGSAVPVLLIVLGGLLLLAAAATGVLWGRSSGRPGAGS